QRDTEHRVCIEYFQRVIRIDLQVQDMHYLPFEHGSPGDRASTDGDWMAFKVIFVLGRISIRGDMFEMLTHRTCYGGLIHLAQPRSRLNQRLEHYLQIKSRAADDLKHVSGRSLLLKRFAQLIEEPRVLDGDDGLIGKGLQ